MILTDRQQEFLNFLIAFEEEHGKPPTFREIAIGMDVTSKGTVSAIIDILVREGFVSRQGGRVRGLSVLRNAA